MKRHLIASALAAITMAGFAADASAWQRNSTVTTGRGTYSFQGGGSCANGSCSRSYTRTGPYGNSYSRSGTVTRQGGHYDYSRTTTGPYGGSVTRSGSFYPYPY